MESVLERAYVDTFDERVGTYRIVPFIGSP